MNRSVIFMFSGQGSQYYQMGRELFEHNPIFRNCMIALDNQVSKNIDASVVDFLYDGEKAKKEIFDRLLYSHPAIFMLEYSLSRVLLKSGIEPDYVLGTSLGEFVSAAVSGIVEPEEALQDVIAQARILESYCESGMMLAICHNPSIFFDNSLINKRSEIASINFDSHFVVSGKKEDIGVIEKFLESKEILYQEIPVSIAFHSCLIDSAKTQHSQLISKKIYKKPLIPFISSATGGVMTEICEDYFWDVVRKPVQFPDAIRCIENGTSNKKIYLDLGPSGTLANFARRNFKNGSSSFALSIITPFRQDTKKLRKVVELLQNDSQYNQKIKEAKHI